MYYEAFSHEGFAWVKFSFSFFPHLELPDNSLGSLLDPRSRLVQHARRHLLDDLHGRLGDVDVLSVDVVPGASDEEGDVVREVEDRGNEGEAEEEEEDGVCVCFAKVRERIRA